MSLRRVKRSYNTLSKVQIVHRSTGLEPLQPACLQCPLRTCCGQRLLVHVLDSTVTFRNQGCIGYRAFCCRTTRWDVVAHDSRFRLLTGGFQLNIQSLTPSNHTPNTTTQATVKHYSTSYIFRASSRLHMATGAARVCLRRGLIPHVVTDTMGSGRREPSLEAYSASAVCLL